MIKELRDGLVEESIVVGIGQRQQPKDKGREAFHDGIDAFGVRRQPSEDRKRSLSIFELHFLWKENIRRIAMKQNYVLFYIHTIYSLTIYLVIEKGSSYRVGTDTALALSYSYICGPKSISKLSSNFCNHLELRTIWI